jgi:iron complex transport system ATP-binding protein
MNIIPEIDRVVLIQQDQLIADGPKAEILTSKQLSELYQTNLHVSQSNGWYRCWQG